MREPSYREYVDVEMEIGATQGSSHADVLERTIGRERALRDVTAGGPPLAPAPLRSRREQAASRLEEE